MFGFESLLQVHGNQGDLPDSDNDSGISKENNFSDDGSTFTTQTIEEGDNEDFLGDCIDRPLGL